MFSAYEKITKYCKDNEKNFAIRNHAYCIYLESLKEALNSQDDPNDNINSISTALLTDSAIQGYVSRAERFTQKIIDSSVEPILNANKRNDFLNNIVTGVVGNFVFSILLVVIFWLGKDQVASWLSAVSK